MTDIVSRLILGASASPETEALVRIDKPQLGQFEQINYSLFETTVGTKVVYCCWSGGYIKDNEPHLTIVGRGAFEALISMPLGQNELVVFQELKLGRTPLRQKIINCLQKVPPATKVCFVGDLAGELDGHMSIAFNPTGLPILIEPWGDPDRG
jgi:hypothetical protein